MHFWIAVWLFVFASALLFAIMADKENRHKNRGMAIFMAVVVLASGAMILRG